MQKHNKSTRKNGHRLVHTLQCHLFYSISDVHPTKDLSTFSLTAFNNLYNSLIFLSCLAIHDIGHKANDMIFDMNDSDPAAN